MKESTAKQFAVDTLFGEKGDSSVKTKRNLIAISIVLFLLISIPICLIAVGFCLPPQYGATYYAVLPKMYENLKKTTGKKIVVVGNSAVAFGLDPELMEGEMDGYTVCPFGLYGAIGTKAMMDLSRVNISEGDIVILAPEQVSQSMSLYFNSEYLWNAADGDFSILTGLRNSGEMVGGFLGYVGRKFAYFAGGNPPAPTDVYAAASFDARCKMTYARPYNKLPLGYDALSRISYDPALFSEDFADYINEYNRFVESRGATLLFGFAPVNLAGIEPETSEEDIDAFYDHVEGLLDCELLGDPKGYLFESDWFYDANVHVNSAGAVVYTDRLVRDLKAYLKDSSPDGIVLPEKPEVPEPDVGGEDGEDAALFTYEESGTGWNITGLTEEGKTRTVLTLPDFYEGKRVLSFDKDVFAGDTALEELHIGRYIYGIADGSFAGCTALRALYLHPDRAPSECSVYFALFDGAPLCRAYVPAGRLADYLNDYFWSRYGAYLTGY